MNNKIKMSVGLIMLSVFTLFGFFAAATPASALTCHDVTVYGTVDDTGTPPTDYWFEYSTNRNTVANGQGTQTTGGTLNNEGTNIPVQQYISGLSENSTYYYQLVVQNDFGTYEGGINNFQTPSCQQNQTYTVNTNAGPGGNISPSSQQVTSGQTTTFSVNPNSGYTISSTSGCNGYLNGNTYTTGAITSNCTVSASFNQNQQQPTVNLTASPSSIQSGQYSTLTWTSQNASSCLPSWTFSSTGTYGSSQVSPAYTTTYNVTCYGNNGTNPSASATVYVNQVQNQTCQDTSANNYGGTLPCTYNAQVCQDVNAINYRGTLPCRYNIQVCQDVAAINYRGLLPCRYQPINNQPTVVLYADQASVPFNGAATVSWLTTNATSCLASGGSLGWAGARSIGPGAFSTGSLTGSRTYSITCSNNVGSASDSVTISVRGVVINNPTPTSLVLISSSVDRNQPIVPTVDNTRPHPGDEINYTVNYQNIGTGAITGLTLRMDLPSEVDYMFSNPSNPTISGNTLLFNLGTLRANGTGTVTVRVKVRENIPNGTNLNFPATLSYIDPSGQPKSVNANVSAQVLNEQEVAPAPVVVPLGANVFGAGFLPANLFGWLILLILVLALALLAKYLFGSPFSKQTTTTSNQPGGTKKTTTTTIQ